MTNIQLTTHEIHPWRGDFTTGSLQMRGDFYYKDVYYPVGLPQELQEISSVRDFEEKRKFLSGNFALVCKCGGKTILAVDRISIYPLFYGRNGAAISVSDSFAFMEQQQTERKGDVASQIEFLAAQMVLGNRTLLQNIFALMAGQYAVIDDQCGEVSLHDYDIHAHTETYPHDDDWLFQKHEEILDDVFTRMIQRLKGRKVVLFLSGGFDSRLIAVQLQKHHYTNVLCVSFGGKKDLEAIVAKEVAEKLGFEWKLLEVDPHMVRKLAATDLQVQNFLKRASNGLRVPYLEAVILHSYFERGELPKDCVIVNGNSGDFIEGEQFCTAFVEGHNYSCQELVDEILKKHFLISGKRVCSHKPLRKAIQEELELDEKRTYSYYECQELFEQFNWRERQSKYVVTSVCEAEELFQVDWSLPLWDDALVDFWLNVPIEERAYRKLYYKIVGHEPFATANVITPYLATVNTLKKKCLPVVRAFYPVKKLVCAYLWPDSLYYTAKLSQFIKILSYTKGYQTNTISVLAYVLTQTIYYPYYGDTCKFLKEHLDI